MKRTAVFGIAIALVLLRSFVATRYAAFFFDSDQAIVGLMARHLSRLHHFPVFYYSLNYILAVEAWVAAPFFWIARSSVTVLRLPFVLLNAGTAVALVAMLSRELAIDLRMALVAALPFIIPTPAAANQMLEVAGANVEPIAYVLALWALRRRPLAFGVLLAIGYLHREFTIFAVPALLVAEWREIASAWRSYAPRVAWTAVGFGVVYAVVGLAKTRTEGGGIELQAASLAGQLCVTPGDVAARAPALVTEALPTLFGMIPAPLSAFRMTTDLVAGAFWVWWVVIAGAALVAVRLASLTWKSDLAVRLGSLTRKSDSQVRLPSQTPKSDFAGYSGGRANFAVYLTTVGAITALAYPLSCNVTLHAPPLLRYLLLAAVIPVGLTSWVFATDRSPLWRGALAAIVVVWSAANLTDNVRLIRTTVANPPVSEHHVLADYLIAHRIRYARAIYWDAYMLDFLSRERVIVASTDLIRIPEYQEEVEAHAADAVVLQRLPCSGDARVASWCVQAPPR